jgi:methylamine dehydrogenase accessory protein MauD
VTTALALSVAVLWVLVVALAVVVLALVRQVGVLHERVAPAGALMGRETPRVGEEAPVIEIPDWHGVRRRIGGRSELGRGTLLVFVSPTCPMCKTLLPVIASVRTAEAAWLDVIVASDGPRDEHEPFVARHGLDGHPYVLSTELGLAYQVGRLPYAVLLDARGVVRARGLVNTREHLESLFEAHERGIASVQDFVAGAAGDDRDRTGEVA